MKILFQDTPNNSTPSIFITPVAGKEAMKRALASLSFDLSIDLEQIQQDFNAGSSEVQLIYGSKHRHYLIGVGENPTINQILKSLRSFYHKRAKKLPADLVINLTALAGKEEVTSYAEHVASGLILGGYQIGKYKTQKNKSLAINEEEASLNFWLPSKDLESTVKQAVNRGAIIADTQRRIMDLVNAPSNKKTPAVLGEWAIESGKQFGYEVEVWDKDKITDTGLFALLAVNQGSANPPRFIIMEHKPSNNKAISSTKIGLVGKGVTFDTGGLSIKGSTNMHFMKSDMGGAAAVLGTLELAARLDLPFHLVGIVPSTENSVDAKSVMPSDVINSYSGKTIEIIDTDAEGRLILADGINYMIRHYQPDVLIDLATLTGSAVRTFGYHAAALFSKDDKLAEAIAKAGDEVGERAWRLPLWDIYRDDIKSDVADVRNYSGKPIAGAIAAAKFLEFFTENHPRWAHLDIAGVAFSDTEFSIQKSATGYGVRLLLQFMEQLYAQE